MQENQKNQENQENRELAGSLEAGEILLQKQYTIPFAMFQSAFAAFQKKFVYPRNYLVMAVLLAVCAFYAYFVVNGLPEDRPMYCMVILCCLVMTAFQWYQPRKVRRNLLLAVREIEHDRYQLTIYPEYLEIGTLLVEDAGNPENPENSGNPENPENSGNPGNPDNSGNPENPRNSGNPGNPRNSGNPEDSRNSGNPENLDDFLDDIPEQNFSGTRIYYNTSLYVREYPEFFMIYQKKVMFYTVPKSAFSEEELEMMRVHFSGRLDRNFAPER